MTSWSGKQDGVARKKAYGDRVNLQVYMESVDRERFLAMIDAEKAAQVEGGVSPSTIANTLFAEWMDRRESSYLSWAEENLDYIQAKYPDEHKRVTRLLESMRSDI